MVFLNFALNKNKKQMKRLFILFLLGLSINLNAQENGLLSGRVIELETEEPVAFATLIIEVGMTEITAYTDENGYFNVYDVPLGRLSITAENIGYESTEKIDIDFEANPERQFIITIKSSKRSAI